MVTKHFINIIVGFTIISCGSKEKASDTSDRVAGAYAREYSVIVTNPQSGKELGMRTIRDTIFVQEVQEGYKISNRKWRLNDYDREGWRSMEHSEDGPLPTYRAVFDPTDNSLSAELMVQLHLNLETRRLYKGDKSDKPYEWVK